MSSNGTADSDFPTFDPLCSIPPTLAFQRLISNYIAVGTVGVYLWEEFDSVLSHYKLLVKHRIRLPTVVYFISRKAWLPFFLVTCFPQLTVHCYRLCCLGYILCATISQTNPPLECVGLEKTINSLYSLTIIFTSLLFFFRTRAVFDRNPCVIAFFAGSWLAVVAACLTFVIHLGGSIGPAKFCALNDNIKPFEITATIVPLVNDTLVFAAITWRLYRNSYAHTLRDGLRTLVFGNYLPMFSKAFLQDGQAYYLTTITVNLITVIMSFNNTIPIVLGVIFAVPNVALMNIMACRVFRNTIFGYFMETEISTGLVSRELNGVGVVPLSLQEDVKAASLTNT